METRILVAELKASLEEVLVRLCEHGESFVIDRDGRAIAAIAPSRPEGALLSVVLVKIGHLNVPEGFGDDLEEIIRSQPPIGEPPAWPD